MAHRIAAGQAMQPARAAAAATTSPARGSAVQHPAAAARPSTGVGMHEAAQQRGGACAPVAAMRDRVAALPPMTQAITKLLIPAARDGQGWTIEDKDGMRASWKIFTYLTTKYGGRLGMQAALEGLELYDEVVADAVAHPGAHPSIDILLHIRDNNVTLHVVEM